MQLSVDQIKAKKAIIAWFLDKNAKQYITLGGYAGTGKSTLVGNFVDEIRLISKDPIKVAFASYTGRAAQNLKNKLIQQKALSSKDTISTIHGLIYTPIENSDSVIIGWSKKPELETDLIIVDEASMVDQLIWADLMSYGIPIIAIGDHGQLPPIKGNFNLMQNPDLKLEEIHRQAKDNPIIKISILARNEGKIPSGQYGKFAIKYSRDDINFNEVTNELLESYDTNTLILCGYNSTRNKVNQFIRNTQGFELAEPQINDRVICLRNNHKAGIYNGMLGTIIEINQIDDDWFDAEIKMDDTGIYEGKIFAKQFSAAQPYNFTQDRALAAKGDLFDFGYALTVHKAQGSQANKVILFEEKFSKMDDDQWRRWLYTAVTRAEEMLYIFGN